MGTFVVAVRLCEADVNAPDWVGVMFRSTSLLLVASDMVELLTRPRPVTAFEAWGWMMRLPETKESKKQIRKAAMLGTAKLWLLENNFNLF